MRYQKAMAPSDPIVGVIQIYGTKVRKLRFQMLCGVFSMFREMSYFFCKK